MNSPILNRRRMLQTTGLSLLGSALGQGLWPRPLHAAEAAPADGLESLNRFPRMVQEYFVARLREVEAARTRTIAGLRTKAEAEAYVQEVRRKIGTSFGPFPERTPLNPRITGALERATYRVEKVLFESRPDFLVTGNLYLPKGRPFPLPGVIGVCGHSANGKAEAAYQAFCQGLVRQGYVVFIIDPIGQGERLQYPGPDLKSRVGVGVREHLQAGNQQFLVGEFLGAWRAWDGIRALDYLLTREEVDAKHLGLTGNSGGGTMTTWLCGLDDRWTMAAPSCFVTTFRRNLENELPADTEQCPPRVLALGLDHEDFLAALAPKPIIILGKEKDYFDARGTEEAYGRLRRLYRLLGTEESLALFQGPTPHGYSQENREAMYHWFNRVTGISDAQAEPDIQIEKDEDLWCAPRGQVVELGSRSVWTFTRAKAERLALQRRQLDEPALRAAVRNLLGLPEADRLPEYRILRPLPSRRYPKPHATTYAVETEPGIHALVYRLSAEPHYSRPGRIDGRAILYVPHRSSDAELRSEPFLRELAQSDPDIPFFSCDPRGVGESQPDTCGREMFLHPYGSDYFYAIHSFMLDAPYVGGKTWDLLRVLEWLGSLGGREIHLVAKGWGTVPATFAALLSPWVTRVTLKGALASYAEIALTEDYDWPLSSFLPGALEHFDLPDCYQALAGKQLQLTP